MNPTEIGIRLVVGVLLIFTNGFFVAIEFALTRARQFIESEFADGGSRLEHAWEMTQELELYLTTCQVGITASSIAVDIVAESALAALFEPLFAGTTLATIGTGALIAYLIINLLHLTHDEQTPAYLGVERSRMVCCYGATPLHWPHVAISPLIRFGDWVVKRALKLFGIEMTGAWPETETDVIESRDQLREHLHSLLQEGEFPKERRDEVFNALGVDELSVSEIMTPSPDIVALPMTATSGESFERIRNTLHTRFPFVGEPLIDFRGIVYAPFIIDNFEALRAGERLFDEITAPATTPTVDTNVSDAFDQFQTGDQELMLVLRNNEVVGLLTATDALETVMGKLDDPLDWRSRRSASNFSAYGRAPRTNRPRDDCPSGSRHRQ